jgi:dephospho-CoA kinase
VNIALTGGIGSGKSSIAAILASALQVTTISADSICRDLMQPDAEGWRGIIAQWGEQYLNSDRTINRGLLRETVFQDSRMRSQLEAILHPLIRISVKERMDIADKSGESLVVEVPLLFEVAWQDDFDCTVAVYAPESVCLRRVMGRDAISEELALKIVHAQIAPEKKAEMAEYVIDNSSLWVQAVQQVGRLARLLRRKSGEEGKPAV